MLQHTNSEQINGLALTLQDLIQDENKVVCDFSLSFLRLAIEFGELQVALEKLLRSLAGCISCVYTIQSESTKHTLHFGFVEYDP